MSPDKMQSDTRDPVREAYRRAERMENAANTSGWVAAFAFAGYVYLHGVHMDDAEVAKLTFVGLSVFSVVCGYVHRFILLPACDHRRRQSLITDSLGVALTADKQDNFWTSHLSTSLERLAMSLAENTFFYSRLLPRSMPGQFALFVILLLALLYSIRVASVEVIELLGLVLLFSDTVSGRLVRTIWAAERFAATYADCRLVIRNWPPSPDRRYAELLNLFGEYESTKARAGTRASERLFNRMNKPLTDEWAMIRTELETHLRRHLEAERSTQRSSDPPSNPEPAPRAI